jgi:hypothetical protein
MIKTLKRLYFKIYNRINPPQNQMLSIIRYNQPTLIRDKISTELPATSKEPSEVREYINGWGQKVTDRVYQGFTFRTTEGKSPNKPITVTSMAQLDNMTQNQIRQFTTIYEAIRAVITSGIVSVYPMSHEVQIDYGPLCMRCWDYRTGEMTKIS